jgi:predicted secreted hydrolase
MMKADSKGVKLRAVKLILFALLIGIPGHGDGNSDFSTVTGPCDLRFPKDHGAHPGYRTEWWYYTGNLKSEIGTRYGFQLTFFRIQISPRGAEKKWPHPASAWRTQQIYLGHAAIADISEKQHLQAELAAREALNLAGASQHNGEISIFIKNWSAQIGPESHLLQVDSDQFSYELTLKPLKAPVLHGQGGYSRKGSTSERASCYYSFTRLETTGKVAIGGKTLAVDGLSWMDHEFGTAALEPDLTGWDWFSLQLSDHTEVMAFLLRKTNGQVSPASSGTYVDSSGQGRHLAAENFKVNVLDTWKSPRSKAVYPVGWRLQIFPFSIDLTIAADLADQEMETGESTGVAYWEGSVSINGTKNGRPLEGLGYVELTGYAEPFEAPM